MKYLITGGAGFIGSHLAEDLIRDGHEVEVVDDLSTGSVQNIEQVARSNQFKFFRGSIQTDKILEGCVARCDMVFHLAAAVGVKLIVDSPVRTIETNILGTERVLSFAAKFRKKVILASTSEVYGKSTTVPFSEEQDLILGPTSKSRWSYAASKAVDEFLAVAYWKEKKLPIVIARLFNTVGPRQTGRYGMVLPSFVRQAVSGEPITVFGDGKQSRCFTHVADVIDALKRLSTKQEAVGQIYNVGSDQEVTINDLAGRVRAAAKSISEIKHVSYGEAYEEGFEDMQRRVPDLRKIKALMGFELTKNIDQIIQDVIHFEKQQK